MNTPNPLVAVRRQGHQVRTACWLKNRRLSTVLFFGFLVFV